MATLTRGRYTYGNQTWANIILITGANVGDTVWDTTYQKKRMWDGNNFVHANQKTQINTAGLINGGVVVVSSTVNNQIAPQQLAVDTEGIIGIVEDVKTGAIGSACTMTYHGDVKALVIASAGNPSAPGDYLKNDTTNVGYATTAAPTAGTFGHYLDASATTTGLRRILFRPVERN
jgi:hypothetical protein